MVDERNAAAVDTVTGNNVLGLVDFLTGNPQQAEARFARAVRAYRSASGELGSTAWGQHPGISAHSYQAWALWMIGQANSARDSSNRALEIAQHTAYPFTNAFAHVVAGWLAVLADEADACRQHGETITTLDERHGFPGYRLSGIALTAYAKGLSGDANVAIATIQDAAERWREEQGPTYLPFLQVMSSRLAVARGPRADALILIENALAHCERTGELALRPEFLRLRGLCQPNDDGPEQQVAGLIEALEAARSQGARAWELRTALSLGELWVSTGRQRAAVKLLRPLSESFTEGFDTPALKQARALLEKVG